jgi:hypothetical protein
MYALPTGRETTWNPGVTGGIPSRTTVYTTIAASTYGNGSSDATSGIQTALNACPSGQVVALSAGDFKVNGINDGFGNYAALKVPSNVTLRGVGPTTRLIKDSAFQASVVIMGTLNLTDGGSTNLTANAAKGATSVSVTSATGFSVGQLVLIDETDDSSYVDWGDSAANAPGGAGRLSWFHRANRPVGQMLKISNINGTTITFTTPLHIAFRTTFTAQLTYWADTAAQFAGLEDVYVTGGQDDNIKIHHAMDCWVARVESDDSIGDSVGLDQALRCTVRDSYIHDTPDPNPGGGGYMLSLAWYTADCLIENNILVRCNKVMVCRSSGGGNVIAYNYTDDGYIGYNTGWQEVGINASHMAEPHYELFEGNYSFNADGDDTWGGAVYITMYRNHLSGKRRSYTDSGNRRAAGPMSGHYYYTYVGNVLGYSGQTASPFSGFIEEDSYPWDINSGYAAMWRVGAQSLDWDAAGDARVGTTLVRDGNYDYVTNSVQWDSTEDTLPNSLYLSSKPAFFGSLTWPWVDAAGSTKLYTLPAKQRFDNADYFNILDFPLSVHASKRYLLKDSRPFLLHGDTCWAIIGQLTDAEIDTYLDDREEKGFNAVLFSAPENYYTSQTPSYNNVDGVAPFTTMSPVDWTSPNNTYWNRVDYLVNGAKSRGMVCIINPAYVGWQWVDGWGNAVNAASAGDLQTYGQFLATRYNQGNIIWCMGGDWSGTAGDRDKQWNIVTGIRSVRTTDLITAHPDSSEDDPYAYWSGYTGFSLNIAYTYETSSDWVYEESATAYGRSGPLPFVYFEGKYEGSTSSTLAMLRRQSYGSMLSGACGQIYGNNPVWHFESSRWGESYSGTWESNLDTTGATEQTYVKALFAAKQWWKLAPETGADLVSSSLSTGTSRVYPALAADGSFAMIYVPTSQTVTCVMSALTPGRVRARLYDPTAGTYATVSGSPFVNTGTQNIATGGERIIVLDSLPGPTNLRWRPA